MIGSEKKTEIRTVRLGKTADRRLVERACAENRHPAELARMLLESALDALPAPLPTRRR